ncbi:probable inactive ATP-dependent zinc metalloprotease FTSHI 5, chloroplastic [Daucus carota subsp. sativus]|uniref:probable inactive ATP-dependent zinc metalloprotease FTSHI 5, chloroplastic n=1 Tax=Daucus carota subsp. sativus TaxID=79200 RepID=UPI003082BA35
MYSTLTTTQNPFSKIPSFPTLNRRRIKFRTHFYINSSQKPKTQIRNAVKFVPFSESLIPTRRKNENDPVLSSADNVLDEITKRVLLTVFCFVVGLCSFGGLSRPRAVLAAPVATEVVKKSKKSKGKEKELRKVKESEKVLKPVKGDYYSDYTKRLLEIVSGLLRSIKEVELGKGDVRDVKTWLKKVKLKKQELQDELLRKFDEELDIWKEEVDVLTRKSDKVLDKVMSARKERESLEDENAKEQIMKLEEEMSIGEKEYNEIMDQIDEIEDNLSMKEALLFHVAVREISYIERECQLLVENFNRNLRLKNIDSVSKSSLTKLSRLDIQNELKSTQRQLWEQMILPSVMENDDNELPFDQDSTDFVERIKKALEDSREMQRNLNSGIRKNMKRFGDEKRFIVNSPVADIVKGYPEIESKWMFGNKEVVSPRAASNHLHHSWKKWREDVKADLKKDLLEDEEFGKKYVAQRQERILLDRDRVVSKTWYNEEKNRREMDPIAVPYAVSRKLVESARIRHDWGAMYVTLKGDDKEYYVDTKEYDMLFEGLGGFDGLYMKMLASDVPTSIQLMWIPFSELSIGQHLLLMMRFAYQSWMGVWNSGNVTVVRQKIFERFKNLNEDILLVIVFPIVEFVIPSSSAGLAWYMDWLTVADMNFRSRNSLDFVWYLGFTVRTVIYGYVLLHVFRFMKRKIPRLLGFGPLRRDPNMRKLRRLKAYFRYRKRSMKRKRKAGVDPISTAFDQMKRVKNPPIELKNFSSIDSMREEINEVVAFLKNPRAFQDMGARAPRGVLIVGERGTGKTSLALAIAAEAKVPLVEVKAQQLEAGLWVGQSASNVRELFQTARDLAPVIIFVEDFDLFAGVRGKFLHTKKQDHEAFINQLLVELDGFEKQEGVVLMATTRNLKQIDEALQRPGRMDRIFHLQQPTPTEREKILLTAAKESMDNEIIDYVDWSKVAEKTSILRPAELKLVPVALEGSAYRSKFLDTDELMSYCSWFATFSNSVPEWVRKTKIGKGISKMLVNHLGLTLTKEDLQSVVDLMEPYGQISNGIELLSPPLDWTRETKFPHAVWASGRGLIALLLPNFDVVDNLWLEPFSWEGIGCTKITKAKNEGSMNGNVESRSYLEKKLVFCFGSYVAAQLLLPFGEENILSSSEIKQAEEIATRMVIQYGWGPDDSPTIYHHNNASTALSMGNKHEYEMAAKVEKLYYLAYDKAKVILQSNYQVLEKIVEELLEHEILTRKDLERIVSDNGGVWEKEPFYLSDVYEEEPVFRDLIENGNASGTALLGTAN